jgi:hypothetical protein
VSPELHARVEAAWSRAWLGFGVVTVLALGLVTWRLVAGTGAPPGDDARDASPPSHDAPGHDAAAAACASVIDCELACDRAGDAAPCLRLATMQRGGAGDAQPDHEAGRAVDDETCRTHGAPRACTRVALHDGLLGDLALAPAWIDAAQGPRGRLAGSCKAGDPLACAALELLGDGAEPRAGAAEIALAACSDGEPEACFLAAGRGLPTAPAALEVLQRACDAQDLPSCFYLWRRSPEASLRSDALLRACTDVSDQPRLAAACAARSASSARRTELRTWACLAGACDGIDDVSVLSSACRAGRLNGCAESLTVLHARSSRDYTPDAALADAATLAPGALKPLDELAIPAASKQLFDACYLGSARGCEQAAAALPAGHQQPAPATLRAYAARLREPLANP